jgi:hypothetical protein
MDTLYNVTEELGLSALPMGYQPVPVHVTELDSDHLLRGYDTVVCPRMIQLQDDLFSSYFWKQKQQYYEAHISPYVTRLLGFEVDIVGAKDLADSLRANIFDGLGLPSQIPQPVYDWLGALLDLTIYWYEFTDEGRNLASGTFLQTLLGNLESFETGVSPTKFFFYSAHDTTIAAILAGLRAPVKRLQPPFASTLLFELWESAAN